MRLFKRMEAIVETENAKLWREYREILERDNPKDADRLAELLTALELTPKHAEFHRAVLQEAAEMAKDAALLPAAQAAAQEAEKKTRELNRAYDDALVAFSLAKQAEPALRRRAIVLAERQSDLLHLRRRFPELLNASEKEPFGEFPDNAPARLRNLARELNLPALTFG